LEKYNGIRDAEKAWGLKHNTGTSLFSSDRDSYADSWDTDGSAWVSTQKAEETQTKRVTGRRKVPRLPSGHITVKQKQSETASTEPEEKTISEALSGADTESVKEVLNTVRKKVQGLDEDEEKLPKVAGNKTSALAMGILSLLFIVFSIGISNIGEEYTEIPVIPESVWAREHIEYITLAPYGNIGYVEPYGDYGYDETISDMIYDYSYACECRSISESEEFDGEFGSYIGEPEGELRSMLAVYAIADKEGISLTDQDYLDHLSESGYISTATEETLEEEWKTTLDEYLNTEHGDSDYYLVTYTEGDYMEYEILKKKVAAFMIEQTKEQAA